MTAALPAPPPEVGDPSGVASPTHFCWQTHPWRQESPLRSASLLVIIGATAVTAAWSFGHLLVGLGSALLLLASTSRYLLPTDHRVDADGASATHLWRTRHLSWRQVKRVDARRDGLFLSPFQRPSRLDSYRGLFIRFGDGSASLHEAIDRWRAPVD